jgi:hypothetical protein
LWHQGWGGWLTAGFIEGDDVCDQAFKEMSKKFKLVYRTPTRVNVNSKNPFYFCVFDTTEANTPIGYDAFEDADFAEYF